MSAINPSSPAKQLGVSPSLIEKRRQYGEKLGEVIRKINEIRRQGPQFFEGPLKESMLPKEIFFPIERDYTVKSFNKLMEQQIDLSVLLTANPLYQYNGGKTFSVGRGLEVIQDLANEYMQLYPQEHFGKVLTYLKKLAGRDLNSLQLFLLEDSRESLGRLHDHSVKQIQSEKEEFEAIQTIRNGKEFYPRGDFTFIADPLFQRILKNGFDEVEKANLWHFFDLVPQGTSIANYGFSHPQMKKVMSAIDLKDGHSGASMNWVFDQLSQLHKKGWEAFSKEWIASYASETGPTVQKIEKEALEAIHFMTKTDLC